MSSESPQEPLALPVAEGPGWQARLGGGSTSENGRGWNRGAEPSRRKTRVGDGLGLQFYVLCNEAERKRGVSKNDKPAVGFQPEPLVRGIKSLVNELSEYLVGRLSP